MKVLILGAGQLGSRYLQGLVHYPQPLEIWALDVQPVSLTRAYHRWQEIGGKETTHSLRLIQTFNELPLLIDLAIVATTADVRLQVVETLVRRSTVRYWVLEKVLTQSIAQIEQLQQAIMGAEGAWVNKLMRTNLRYQKLRESITTGRPIRFYIGDKSWGLASNSVHLLDFVTWYTKENPIFIDISQLDQTWFESKRPGFYEVGGILKTTFSGGSEAIFESRKDRESHLISLETAEWKWVIDEVKGVAINQDGTIIHGKFENISEVTPRLVESILKTGHCDLPTLEESIFIHRIFLKTMLEHWNKVHDRNDKIIPIT